MKHRITLVVLLPLVTFAILALTLVTALHHGIPSNKFSTHMGEPTPQTHLPAIGETVTFFDTTDWHGRPYIVNFFASWCLECRAEHLQLMGLSAAHIPLVGIALQDKVEALNAYLTKLGNPYLIIADDAKSHAAIDWGLTGVPETFVIDTQGIIRFHYVGPLTDDVVKGQLLPLWDSLQP